MNRHRGARIVLAIFAALALPLAAAAGERARDEIRPVLPRDTVIGLDAVTRVFPDVTQEAETGPNETSIGEPDGSISVVFTSADGTKKVTVSIDRYASVAEAAAAYESAVQGSEAAPGFKPSAAPALGEAAFAGTSQVGDEKHFGLGARDGSLIVSATHAGAIPVTPENSAALIALGAEELAVAKRAFGASSND